MKKKAINSKAVTKSRLEEPVHNMISYGVLLALACVVLAIVYSLQLYIIP